VAGVRHGTRVEFRVPAFPGRTFNGRVARIDRALDAKTRTMAVELEVGNPRGELAPGMYPEVSWPVSGGGQALLVPPTAVVTTTERTFVIRVKNGRAEWVDVKKRGPAGELIEVLGSLSPGDLVVRRATDEIRDGARLEVRRPEGVKQG
jgi:multidrug efflux pump subunit AcrA (membrane-fusion protein)